MPAFEPAGDDSSRRRDALAEMRLVWTAAMVFADAMSLTYKTIGEVLVELDATIAVARARGSADGYFAALYRRVTAEVEARIARGAFQDGPRMARFDIIFASRYVDAWKQRERGESPAATWAVAFECDRHYWPVVLQHLLVGMNAHINLDLGIAAAEVAPGASIHALEHDFNLINDILCEMVDDVQDRLGKIWPAMRMIDRICDDFDESVIHFSIRHARAQAWAMAVKLATAPDEAARLAHIQIVDPAMAALGRRVLNPGIKLSLMLAWVRFRERGSVAEKVDVMLR